MITGQMFKSGIISASNNISNSRQAVDALNIFPVPDGDTGTNMSRTIAAAATELSALDDDCTIGEVSSKCANALLRGARGNSGVILSLIFRGISKALKGKDTADSADVAAALAKGVEAAYKAVMNPTEGTILTVVRKASEAAQGACDAPDTIDVCHAALEAAKDALAKTPEQLPVLKKAGVVDAGGQGLVLIMEGMGSVFKHGTIVQAVDGDNAQSNNVTSKSTVAMASDDIKFGYCSEFLIEKTKDAKHKDPLALRAYLESIGDCVVVVDDNDVIKVHVHSNEPGNVIQNALKYGQLINIKIDNMRHQHKNADESEAESNEQKTAEPENDYGFVAVCAGDGLASLFSDIGADVVVSGGQTMNPSTEDLFEAVLQTPAKNVYILPNNKNIIMAAEQTKKLAKDRTVHVLQTKTIPQGISAMLVFDETASTDENTEAMNNAAAGVDTGMVTFAARDSEVDGQKITKDEIMGMVNGDIKYLGKDVTDIAYQTACGLLECGEHSLITIIFGSEATEEQAEQIEKKLNEKYHSAVEISIVEGGQPIYYFIISAE